MQKSLVAFDTDHIKNYVFGTDKLKEIRGASSLLDRLNRIEMEKIASYSDIRAASIYVNGGSGLFLVDQNNAERFGQRIQQKYRELTGGGASVTVAVQPLPSDAPQEIDQLLDHNLSKDHTLELMRYKLREEKEAPPEVLTLPSHPFMRPCDSCGILYAEVEDHDRDEAETFYCRSCKNKRDEDDEFRARVGRRGKRAGDFLWGRIFSYLDQIKYSVEEFSDVERPKDFNEFRHFAESKEYIGLIYADANNMGTSIEKIKTLKELRDFAGRVDDAIFLSMCQAIKAHLPVFEIKRQEQEKEKKPALVFPFDILLVGGDDIVMVTDAAKAMDVALTIAKEFRVNTRNQHSLCVGVVLAPIKYPFGLLQDMAESALKFAKKTAADDREKAKDQKLFDGTRINFQVVTGGSYPDFNETYKEVYQKVDKNRFLEFHASLRAYKPEDLELLLNAIREGHKLNLGRTKLHQLREAILEKNLTTSVQKGLATLRNWREKQRTYVVGQVYGFGQRHQMQRSDSRNPVSDFPRVTFPWFADGTHKKRTVYRTSLLDFIELYDFVTREGGSNGDEV